jgi:hypothetical protein
MGQGPNASGPELVAAPIRQTHKGGGRAADA